MVFAAGPFGAADSILTSAGQLHYYLAGVFLYV